jgi:hypothetical protein
VAAAAANGHGHGHGEDDTIEKNVQGLAQAVLAADEARQAAELVSIRVPLSIGVFGLWADLRTTQPHSFTLDRTC